MRLLRCAGAAALSRPPAAREQPALQLHYGDMNHAPRTARTSHSDSSQNERFSNCNERKYRVISNKKSSLDGAMMAPEATSLSI